MEVNPVKAAIDSFGAVNDIFRQDRADERQKTLDTQAVQQRQFENDRQIEADKRAADTHAANMKIITDQAKVRQVQADKFWLQQAATNPDIIGQMPQDAKDRIMAYPEFAGKSLDALIGHQKAAGTVLLKSGILLDPNSTPEQKQAAGAEVIGSLYALDETRFQDDSGKQNRWPFKMDNTPNGVVVHVHTAKEDGTVDLDSDAVLSVGGNSVKTHPNEPVQFHQIKDLFPKIQENSQTYQGVINMLTADEIKHGGGQEEIKQAVSSGKAKKVSEALKKSGLDDRSVTAFTALTDAGYDADKAAAIVKSLKPDKAEKTEVKFGSQVIGAPSGAKDASGNPIMAGSEVYENIDRDGNRYYSKAKLQAVVDPNARYDAMERRADKKASRHEIDLGAKDHERAVNAYYKFVKDNPNDAFGESKALLDEANKAADAQTERLASHKARWGELYTGGGQVVSGEPGRGRSQSTPQPRTSDPDLATAKAYVQKYGDKQKAMEAWHRGE